MAVDFKIVDGIKYAPVKQLHKWKDNPRDVSVDDYERLKEQGKLGEHSTLLVMPDGTTLGGNTRLSYYEETGKEMAKVIVADIHEEDGQWVADIDGQRADRTFESKDQAMLEYALSHNDQIGRYNDVKLAELLHATPIKMQTFKVATFNRPVEEVAFEAGPPLAPGDSPADGGTPEAIQNDIRKQMVLYFDEEQYQDVMLRMEALREKFGAANNPDLLLALIAVGEAYEQPEAD